MPVRIWAGTAMNSDPLTALKDIYPPVEPHWWPPAPGWWLVALLLFAVLGWSLLRLRAYWHATRPIRAAKLMINTLIAEEAKATSSDALLANQCNEVLKRLLVVALDMRDLASLSGAGWLAALDRISQTSNFTQGAGQALGESRFAADFSVDRRALLQSVKSLLGNVHYRKSHLLLGSAT